MLPFFYPLLHPSEDGPWYLAEDYAFSERARQCGYRIMADTSLRLWHLGNYRYSWEDAGTKPERSGSYTLHLPKGGPEAAKESRPGPAEDR